MAGLKLLFFCVVWVLLVAATDFASVACMRCSRACMRCSYSCFSCSSSCRKGGRRHQRGRNRSHEKYLTHEIIPVDGEQKNITLKQATISIVSSGIPGWGAGWINRSTPAGNAACDVLGREPPGLSNKRLYRIRSNPVVGMLHGGIRQAMMARRMKGMLNRMNQRGNLPHEQ